MSESTLISILPQIRAGLTEFYEKKPGLRPGEFAIPVVDLLKDKDSFALSYVPDCDTSIYLGFDRGSITVKRLSFEVAHAIVQDYLQSKVETDNDSHPGLGFIEGRIKYEDILLHHSDKLEYLRSKQTSWFRKLVFRADDDWNKYHSHKAISDEQRYASRFLGLDREWVVETKSEGLIPCPFCQTRISSLAVICPICRSEVKNTLGIKAVDKVLPKETLQKV